jgi:hypothetical protein
VTLRWLLLHRFEIYHSLLHLLTGCVLAFSCSIAANAGGPKYVAGVSYFNPAVLGQPLSWSGGKVHYYVDPGTLGPLSNQQAISMVDAAAAIWSGVVAQVTSILPTEITAQVASSGVGVTGSQDLTVNDLPTFYASATNPGGLCYDSATGDGLTLVTAPANQVPGNVPQPFSPLAKGTSGTPAAGVTILYPVICGTATPGLRPVNLRRDHHRRRPRLDERDCDLSFDRGGKRLPVQRVQPAGAFLRSCSASPDRSHASPLSRCGSDGAMARPGACTRRRKPCGRPTSNLAELDRDRSAKRFGLSQRERNRLGNTDSRTTRRGPDCDYERLHQGNRHLCNLRGFRLPAGVRDPGRRLRHQPEHGRQRNACGSNPARSG